MRLRSFYCSLVLAEAQRLSFEKNRADLKFNFRFVQLLCNTFNMKNITLILLLFTSVIAYGQDSISWRVVTSANETEAVLYTGKNNVIHLSSKLNDLTYTASTDSFTIQRVANNSFNIIVPEKTNKKQIIVTFKGKSKQEFKTTFNIQTIKNNYDIAPRIGNLDTIASKKDILAQTEIIVTIGGKYKPSEYRVFEGDIILKSQTYKISGSKITPEVITAFKSLAKGDKIILSQFKCLKPDSFARILSPVTIHVK